MNDPIQYPDQQFCQSLRRRLHEWSDQALIEIYRDADVAFRDDPRDCAAEAIRSEMLKRGLKPND
jgi:hypothetical protein